MSDTITSHPLSWPRGYERTAPGARLRATFGTTTKVQGSASSWTRKRELTVAESLSRLHHAFNAFTKPGKPYRIIPEQAVISTNMKVRLDGLPYSGQSEPLDVGVAVYFEFDGKATVMCCDKWTRVADNLNSIAATLDAMRALERYGVSESERAFTGFMALPAPGEVKARTCWEVLGIAATTSAKAINEAWRERAKTCHPDTPGGSHDAMSELNTARDQAAAQATQP